MKFAGGWVIVEGLNGVGKTYLATRLAARLGPSCCLLGELTDHGADRLTGQVIAALARPGGTFLRTGHPLTETFAFLALKVYEYERLAPATRPVTRLVLEDRGPDTVAVYQSAILTADDDKATVLVERIATVTAMWRPKPTLTLLVVDDFDTCIDRFASRLGSPLVPQDRTLLTRVDQLYRELAAREPDRFRIVDRAGRHEGDVLDEMHAHCRTVMKGVVTP